MQITSGDVFLTTFWLCIILILWMPAAWLLMRFLTPKKLIGKYFKKPHFTSAELALFSHFPGTLIRTGIFMNLCVFPRFGGKRQMLDIRENVPQWYIVSARCFVFLFTINALSLILLFIGLIIFIEFFKS